MTTFDFTVPETVDLSDPDRQLTDTETSDVIHRADFPRMTVRRVLGDASCGVMTRGATDIADARCGVPPDHDGSHPNRGTLRWYRHYLARLDEFADQLVPDWREQHRTVSPFPWCEIAFGSVFKDGRTASPIGESYGRDSDRPRVIGHWTFSIPANRA